MLFLWNYSDYVLEYFRLPLNLVKTKLSSASMQDWEETTLQRLSQRYLLAYLFDSLKKNEGLRLGGGYLVGLKKKRDYFRGIRILRVHILGLIMQSNL